jgi:predicted transcriptional regulator
MEENMVRRKRQVRIIDMVVTQLLARRGDWRMLCAISKVPYSTVTKIAQGVTQNPRIQTVQALLDAFEYVPPFPR